MRRTSSSIPTLLAFILAVVLQAQADTMVGGTILTQTWTKAYSPYRVSTAITVPASEVLTIEPGVDVLFDADVQFRVEGRLIAVGTEGESIEFTAGAAPEWGGIRISGGHSSTIAYARISAGHADGAETLDKFGGGIILLGGGTVLDLSHSTIESNRAVLDGGGVFLSGATLFMRNCLVRGNTSDAGGGVEVSASTTSTIETSVIEDNRANVGSALTITDNSNVTISNCLIRANKTLALTRGSLYVLNAARATVVRCTFYGNTYDGGIGVFKASSVAEVNSSIIWANEPGSIIGDGLGSANVVYSDLQGGYAGSGNIDADPQFVDASGGDFHLLGGSPCVNTGDPALPLDPDGSRADMGAAVDYESVGAGNPTCEMVVTTTTWTEADSPYHVECNMLVPSGETLTIEPGVDVLFDEDVHFRVEGNLAAIGAPSDSIRFLSGDAANWGGIRIVGGESVISYARISGGHARGADDVARSGGGVFVQGQGTSLVISRSTIEGNTADHDGGGLFVSGATVQMLDCMVRDNTADAGGGLEFSFSTTSTVEGCTIQDNFAVVGGGITITDNSVTVVKGCLIANNASGINRGSVYVLNGAYATLLQCSVAGDQSPGGAVTARGEGSLANLNSTIVWGNPLSVLALYGGTVYVAYSDIERGWPGVGNINADPRFVDPAKGDYRLQPGSPCIDTGDPALPLDPDGSRADMGAYPFLKVEAQELVLPKLLSYPGDTIIVRIRATAVDLASADLGFLFDTTALSPVMPGFLVSHALDDRPLPNVEWHVDGDTVRISLVPGISSPISLYGEEIAAAAFVVRADAPLDVDAPLLWLPEPSTNMNETAATTTDGFVRIRQYVPYGEVSGDGEISSFDASLVLQYVVRIRREIDFVRADVSGNGYVSSYDAAHILERVMDREYCFPVETELLPKPTPGAPCVLAWVREGAEWTLRTENPSGLRAGDLTLVLPDDRPATVTGGELTAYRQEGDQLLVAFVRLRDGGDVLLRVGAGEPLPSAPEIRSARFDEGAVPFGGVVRPTGYVLEQNVPNPFNPRTTIEFTTPASGVVSLTIWTASGQIVRTLVDGQLPGGTHEVVWDGKDGFGRDVASGLYVCRLTSRQGLLTRKMMLVR